MLRRTLSVIALLLLAPLMASCGEEPPPDGFHIMLRFTSLNPVVFDQVRVSLTPEGMDEEFMFAEPISYAEGNISFSVAMDGAVDIFIDGTFLANNATLADAAYTYDLEVYSDDTAMRTPPRVRVFGMRGGDAIAEGFLFLPQWPLPLGGSVLIMVPCNSGFSDRCFP